MKIYDLPMRILIENNNINFELFFLYVCGDGKYKYPKLIRFLFFFYINFIGFWRYLKLLSLFTYEKTVKHCRCSLFDTFIRKAKLLTPIMHKNAYNWKFSI